VIIWQSFVLKDTLFLILAKINDPSCGIHKKPISFKPYLCWKVLYKIQKAMKTIVALLLVAFGTATCFSQENENPANPGDNFSLEGALAMFKKANSLKNFERIINDKKNNVNNLDLNDDGEIDYINVDDIKNGDTHILVLSTYLSETEKQDIATISIEKTGEEQAVLQIEGDANLYAENTIIEPTQEKETLKDTKNGGPNTPIIEVH
jgi:hypothetical protein